MLIVSSLREAGMPRQPAGSSGQPRPSSDSGRGIASASGGRLRARLDRPSSSGCFAGSSLVFGFCSAWRFAGSSLPFLVFARRETENHVRCPRNSVRCPRSSGVGRHAWFRPDALSASGAAVPRGTTVPSRRVRHHVARPAASFTTPWTTAGTERRRCSQPCSDPVMMVTRPWSPAIPGRWVVPES